MEPKHEGGKSGGWATFTIVVLGLIIFGPSINDPFHFDDDLILRDSNVTQLSRWHHFLNPLHLRQVTFFSFFLNHQASGPDPAPFHAVNVALHIANTLLLLALLRRLTGSEHAAVIGALVFLVHPVQTEPVLYIYQRSTLLACGFSIGAVLAWMSSRRIPALVLFVLAFESKESALAVPMLLALFGWYSGRMRTTAAVSVLVSVSAVATAALVALYAAGESTVGFGAGGVDSPWSYGLTQAGVIYRYLSMVVWPTGQSLIHDVPFVEHLTPSTAVQIAGLAAIFVAAAVALYCRRHVTVAAIAMAFGFLLAPTSSVIPNESAMFEHRMYLPMTALAAGAGLLLEGALWRRRLAFVLVGLAVLVSISRASVWSTGVRLWEDTVAKAPGSARAHFNLGGAYMSSGARDRARESFEKAIALHADSPEAWYNLGVIEQDDGRPLEALSRYERAVALRPGYWPAWNNMAGVMMTLGQRPRAIEWYETTLQLNPDHWPAQYNIGLVHFANGDFAKAAPRFRTALDWDPAHHDARFALAECLDRTGFRNEAEEHRKRLRASGYQAPVSGVPGIRRE